MTWRLGICFIGLFLLAACSGPVSTYHNIEGGAIAQQRQAPPGANLPYPNLASVPVVPVALNATARQAVAARVAGTAPDVSAPAPGALAGLELPDAAPPEPNLPGLKVPQAVTPMAPVTPVPATMASPPPSVPVELAFAPGSALLDHNTAVAIAGLAPGVGAANVLVGGFGEAVVPGDAKALRLAVARARRLADALTAAGVPGASIRLVAAAIGSGGFVQLVY